MSKSKQKPAPQAVTVKASSTFNPAFFSKLLGKADAEIEFVRALKLADEEEQEANDRLIAVKKLLTSIEEEYQKQARPHLDAVNKLRALVKPYKDKATLLYGAWSSAVGALKIDQTERAAAALDIAREAAAERDHSTAAAGVNLAKSLEAAPVKGTSGGSASFKVHWEVADVDISKLPEEYVLRTPDLDKLRTIADATDETANPPEIEGVVWRRATSQRVGTK